MRRKNIFGGCNSRMNVSRCDNNMLYYCSQSNILISDTNCVVDVLLLDNYLSFVDIRNNYIISGDTSGIFYVIVDKVITRHWFSEPIQKGCFLNEEIVAISFLKKILLYDIVSSIVINKLEFDSVVSTFECCNECLFVAFSNGLVKLYNKDWKQIKQVEAHTDRVQDIKCKMIDDELCVATSSKDCSIQIWKINDGKFDHVQTLSGHRDWVYNLTWTEDGSVLSSSADKTVIEWHRSGFTWSSTNILGGAKPFYNAFVLDDSICAQSHTGAFYKFQDKICDFISGHTNEVMSVDWNKNFLLTTSTDETARIFYEDREVGRPVSHGYPLSTGKFVNKRDLNVILGSQETIIRVFEPTYLFCQCCEWLNEKRYSLQSMKIKNEIEIQSGIVDMHLDSTPDLFGNIEDYKIAAVPAELSLTNDVIEEYDFEGVNEYLLSTTTFSEKNKMYGHYFEVSDIAVSDKYIASCNKSLTKKFAGIFLWNKDYDVVDYLEIHSYGIIKLRFSRDGKYLCAVSKDKTSSLYEVTDKLVFKNRNVDHKRVVWDCSFSHDNNFYATCSRDKCIFVYELSNLNKIKQKLEFNNEITTIDFSPITCTLIAGAESGDIYTIEYFEGKFELAPDKTFMAHSQKVTSLRFDDTGRYIATCGKDGLVNVIEV